MLTHIATEVALACLCLAVSSVAVILGVMIVCAIIGSRDYPINAEGDSDLTKPGL